MTPQMLKVQPEGVIWVTNSFDTLLVLYKNGSVAQNQIWQSIQSNNLKFTSGNFSPTCLKSNSETWQQKLDLQIPGPARTENTIVMM